MKKSTILFALLSSLVATNAIAQDSGVSETGIRYNHVGAGYARVTPDDGGSMSGYAINGGLLISKDIYLTGNYSAVSNSSTNADR
jgi:hypothetical protein